MHNLWMRQVELLISGKKITAPIRIDFKIDFDNKPEPNIGDIKLYNLSDDTISTFKKDTPIILNAGYKGNMGTIFAGEIIKSITDWQGEDKITTIKAGDGVNAWLGSNVSKTFKAGIRASQVIKDIVGDFGFEIGEIKLTEDITYSSGKVVHGKLQQVLQQVVGDCKSKLTITNGVVLIRPPQGGTQTGFLLNSKTGLIGSPGYVDSDDIDYTVKSLLNHRITADSLIKVESKTANGNFRVIKGNHSGNDEAWITTMEVVAI